MKSSKGRVPWTRNTRRGRLIIPGTFQVRPSPSSFPPNAFRVSYIRLELNFLSFCILSSIDLFFNERNIKDIFKPARFYFLLIASLFTLICRLSINFLAQHIHSSRTKFRFESEKSKKKCVITAWGDDGGQGRLMPRNGCNERGPGSGRSNDLCNTTAWPHQIWYRGTCWEHVETPPPWLDSRGGKKCVQHVRRGLRAKLYGHRRLLSCAYRGRIGNLYLRLMIEREKKKWALEFGTKLLEGDNNNVFGGRGFIEGIGVGRNNVFGN